MVGRAVLVVAREWRGETGVVLAEQGDRCFVRFDSFPVSIWIDTLCLEVLA